MSKALSFVSLLFGLLVIGSTYALLAGPDNSELRAQLVGILVVEGVAFTGLMLFLVRPIKVAEGTAARIVEELAARSGAWKYDD